jgi:hypothetical protein
MSLKRSLFRSAVVFGGATFAFACGGSDGQDVLAPGTATGSSGSASGGLSDAGQNGQRCTSESEPNDTRERANALAGTFCGAVATRDDVDILTFAIKATTKTMTIRFEGRVTLTVDVEGEPTVTLGGGGTQVVPFVRGKPYFVTISAAGSAPQDWRVDLIEQ